MLRDFSAVTIIDPGCIYIKGEGSFRYEAANRVVFLNSCFNYNCVINDDASFNTEL